MLIKIPKPSTFWMKNVVLSSSSSPSEIQTSYNGLPFRMVVSGSPLYMKRICCRCLRKISKRKEEAISLMASSRMVFSNAYRCVALMTRK
jgi:hypothetical protein